MKPNKSFLLAVFLLCAVSALAVPHRWVAEVSRPVSEEVFAFQGETIEFYPEITAYGEPFVADAYQLHYQTNGMGGLFFSGAITTNLPVLFTPSMDIGATSYSFFVESTNSVGLCFRSFGTIKMRKSPGFAPNTIPLPVSRIDFACTAYTNAPWLLAESDPGIPSAVSNAVAQAQSNTTAFVAANKTFALYNPSAPSEYLDGAGNKHVVSNFWEMTFSADFGMEVAFPTAQTNYLFTSWGQQYFEGTISYYWLGHPVYLTYWSINLTGIYHKPGGFYTRDWLPTTNALVLDPVAETGATGYAFIRAWSTTNLIATLASQAEVAGLVSTNETRHVRLNTLTVTNKITAADGTTVIIPRTRTLIDSASVVAADWQNRYLYNSSARLTLDWDGGILTAYHPVYGYSQSLDWINRALMDSDEHTAMAWGDRNLQFPTAGIAIDWSLDNAVTINGSVSIPGTALIETELHRDSYTNIIWRSVYSNGWMWLVAYTNYPAN